MINRRNSLLHPALSTCFAITLILLNLVSCQSAPLPTAPLATLSAAPLPPCHRPVIGLCEDYPKETRTLAHARRDLDVCRASGAKVLRIAFSWLDMEPSPGHYDFSFWDDFIPLAVHQYHLRLIPYICYTPRWAASSKGEDYWHSPPRNPEDFARFVHALVTHYKADIHSWELWNEPDNPAYWTGTNPQFAALVRAGSRAVRAADPHATVVLGGIAGTTSFVAQLLRDEHLSSAIDVINMHAYYETWNEDPLESIPDYIRKVHDLITRYGNHQQIWLAEAGYSDFRKPGSSYVSDQYTARFSFEHTPEFQAQALERSIALALSTNDVSLIAWYRINDLPAAQNVIGDVNNRYLGLIDMHDHPKPAFSAMKRITAFFSQPLRCTDARVLRISPIRSPIEVHTFATATGDHLLTAWERTDVPGEAAPPAASANGDSPSSTLDTFSLLYPRARLSGPWPEAQVEQVKLGSLVTMRVSRDSTLLTKCSSRP